MSKGMDTALSRHVQVDIRDAPKEPLAPPVPARSAWSERLRLEAQLLYSRGTKTVSEIALELHVTEKTVAHHLGAPHRERVDHDILVLWQRGMVPLAIAGRLETSVRRVSSVIREAQREALADGRVEDASRFEIPGYLTRA